MSGIATTTRRYVKALEGTKTRVLDTRKTTPGMRMLEKEAVRIGGGVNHRIGLFDMILLKDNHVDFAGGIEQAITRAQSYLEEKRKKLKIEIEDFALEGLADLTNTIKLVHANLNRDLRLIGLLRVMFDPRITLQQQVSDQLKRHYGDRVFDTVIPRNVRLAEAPSYGLPGVVFDSHAKGSQAFIAFAHEMVQRGLQA